MNKQEFIEIVSTNKMPEVWWVVEGEKADDVRLYHGTCVGDIDPHFNNSSSEASIYVTVNKADGGYDLFRMDQLFRTAEEAINHRRSLIMNEIAKLNKSLADLSVQLRQENKALSALDQIERNLIKTE